MKSNKIDEKIKVANNMISAGIAACACTILLILGLTRKKGKFLVMGPYWLTQEKVPFVVKL